MAEPLVTSEDQPLQSRARIFSVDLDRKLRAGEGGAILIQMVSP
jgi:hypothetical protein